jgi:hypothetical protein
MRNQLDLQHHGRDWYPASPPNTPPGCKSRLIGCHIAGCIVASMVRKAPPAEARWILSNRSFPWGQALAVQIVGTACTRETSSRAREKVKSVAAFHGIVVSPLLFSVISQHNIPHTNLDTVSDGGGYIALLHLWPREEQRNSTPYPAEGGMADVFFNSGLVLQIHGDGLKWRRYITMPSGSSYPYNCFLAMSVDLSYPHYRSICLGRPD